MHKSEMDPIHAQPLVSIVMGTYNGQEFLCQQIDSIIGQTYSNLEIIIQDDGSSDETCNILRHYASKDSRIQFFQNKENLGIVQNFYDLIDKARGEYIAISDQDDIWKPNKIESLLNHIGNHSLIYSDSQLIDQSGDQTGKTLLETLGHTPKSGKMLLSCLTENTVSGHACLFSKSIVPKILKHRYDPLLEEYMYDMCIALTASLNNGVHYYETPLTFHRIHDRNSCNHSIGKTKVSSKLRRQQRSCGFLERKRQRVEQKIQNARERLTLTLLILDKMPSTDGRAYKIISNAKAKFERCFFNWQLHHHMMRVGLDKNDSKSLSFGRLYYLFFRVF